MRAIIRRLFLLLFPVYHLRMNRFLPQRIRIRNVKVIPFIKRRIRKAVRSRCCCRRHFTLFHLIPEAWQNTRHASGIVFSTICKPTKELFGDLTQITVDKKTILVFIVKYKIATDAFSARWKISASFSTKLSLNIHFFSKNGINFLF